MYSIEIIAWVGFSQGLFGAIMLLSKSDKHVSDRLLAGWLTLLAFEFLTCAIDFRVLGYSLLSSSFLLFNPALFIYIRSLVHKDFKLKWLMILHLLPFVVFETLAYITKTPFTFENFFKVDPTFPFRVSFAAATIASALIYLPLSVRLLHRYRRKLQNEKSLIEKGQSLEWLLSFSIIYIVYSIIAGILGFVFVFMEVGSEVLTYYNYSFLLLLIYIISFYGVYQQNIEVQTEADDEEESKHISYKNSLLTSDDKLAIKQKVISYMEEDKAYLNPELNMDLLSEATGFPKYQITEVLNMDIGMNFFSFVNSYRIEDVKKMLLAPNLKYSIEAIGYECGFNSKSSFYTVFKKITGMTPIAFRKNNLSQ